MEMFLKRTYKLMYKFDVYFRNIEVINRGVSHYRILPVSCDIGWPVQQLDYFRYIIDLTI